MDSVAFARRKRGMCHRSSEDAGRPIAYRRQEIAFNPEALRREKALKTLELLDAYVNFSYLRESILGMEEGASIA